MIELFESDLRENHRQSSKGNQLKWENDGLWYKADYTGYEGLAEYMVSALLTKSTLNPEEFALYELEEIKYKKTTYNGVKSQNFLSGQWQIITLERLFKTYFDQSLNQALWSIPDVKERFSFVVSQVERITGLRDFGVYLNKLLTIDAFFLNEDRHMHNIAVLMNERGEFAYCPIFDHGGSLLSDTTMDYPLSEDTLTCMKEVRAKTISTDFDEQLDVSEEFCGTNLRFQFTGKDIEKALSQAKCYPIEICSRVEFVLREQMRKYKYLFD